MTISASDPAADSDRLERSHALYRDLSVALCGKIAQLKAGTGGDAGCRRFEDALDVHQRLQQALLDAEASLVKRSNAWAAGPGGELDLDAARAEILARLAVWVAEG